MSTTPSPPTPDQARAFLYALAEQDRRLFTDCELANMSDTDVLLYADYHGMHTADDTTGEQS